MVNKTFNSNLGDAITATSTTFSVDALRMESPIYIAEGSRTSAIEIGANIVTQNLLNLDNVVNAKEAVTVPAYESTGDQFTTIDHVEPGLSEFTKAHSAVLNFLPSLVDELFDKPQDIGLKGKLTALQVIKDEEGKTINITPTNDDDSGIRYEKLFHIGRILVKQISLFEMRRKALEDEIRNKTIELGKKRRELTLLGQDISAERNNMFNLNNVRLERLGDYVVAQKLTEEDWQRVENVFIRREKILRQLRGLYFVKPRSVSLSSPLPDPLELRFASKDDIVPGCSTIEEPSFPDELGLFVDTVLEIPITHWKSLRPMSHLLPNRYRMEKIYNQRQVRLQRKRKSPAPNTQTPIFTRLTMIIGQVQGVLHEIAQRQLTDEKSYRKYQERGAEVLSLEDAISGSSGPLRRTAESLRERLEQCIACMMDTLGNVPPSIRLQWAQLAEDSHLIVNDATRWPGLERAEKEDFNAIRSLVELNAWWFAQLDEQADGSSRTAMNNLIRACLIIAALGDPNEIIKGNVAIPPKRFQIGENMRLKLNRDAQPGTTLQLLDKQQRYVGLLKITDHDEQGTLANIISVGKKEVDIDDGFTVVANKKSKQLFR